MISMKSPFDILPEKFFSPLASKNREHYCMALLLFYDKFLTSPVGVDRNALLDDFERYCEGASFIEPEDEAETGLEEGAAGTRGIALRILKKIMDAGWVSEETLHDFSRIVNISSFAKPFFEALHFVTHGGGIEYESHIVAVYSLLCSDASEENGHYTVMRAHEHTMLLLDSLKVLSQNIKGHFEVLFSSITEIRDILRAHYDKYMEEIVDRAYNRLKTSDNLSRYRPAIIGRINSYLEDGAWLEKTARKLSLIRSSEPVSPDSELVRMLVDIRESLRAIDPLIDDIDRRNRKYSRISTEKIKNRLYADSTMLGKLVVIAGALADGRAGHHDLVHSIFRFRSISSESCYNRWKGEKTGAVEHVPSLVNDAGLNDAEDGIRRRIALQLNAAKVASYLDGRCGENFSIDAGSLVHETGDYVKILYGAVYASAPSKRFPFSVDWDEGIVRAAGSFEFISHRFTRRGKQEK